MQRTISKSDVSVAARRARMFRFGTAAMLACACLVAGGCVVAPPRVAVRSHAVWVPGHYGPHGHWIGGHWR